MFEALQAWDSANTFKVSANLATCLQWQAYQDCTEDNTIGGLEKYLQSLDVLGPAIEAGDMDDSDVFTAGLGKALLLTSRQPQEHYLRAALLQLQRLAKGSLRSDAAHQRMADQLIEGAAGLLGDLPVALRLALKQNPGAMSEEFLSGLGWR